MTPVANNDLTTDGQVAAVAGDDGKAMPIGNDLSPKDVEKKKIGGVYQCQSCNADYFAKTTWQKFCPACGAERKKGVMLAKKLKSKAAN